MRRASRSLGWILAATALHAGAVVVLRLVPHLATLAIPSIQWPMALIDIEWVPATEEHSASAAATHDSYEESSSRGRSTHAGRASSGQVSEPGSDEGVSDGIATGPAAPESTSRAGWSLSPLRGGPSPNSAPTVDLGVGPKLAWQLMPEAKRLRDPGTERGEATAGGLTEVLDAHDQEIGLGRGGAIVSAMQSVARGESAPATGKALFDVSVDTSGKVWVGLASADGQTQGWNKVGGELASSLQGKKFRVPPGSRGMRFRVEVEAKVVEVGGEPAGPKKTKVEASTGKVGENGLEKLPGIYASGGGRICKWHAGLLPLPQQPLNFAGWCDPTRLMEHPQRVVSARVVSESRL